MTNAHKPALILLDCQRDRVEGRMAGSMRTIMQP